MEARVRRGRSTAASAGIVFVQINHDVDDPRRLVIYLGGSDLGRLRAFVASPELAEGMRKSGVKGKPEFELYRPIEDMTRREPLAAVIVRHTVKDFDAWKAQFDAHAATRADAGIVGHGISCTLDDPNTVCVFLQAPAVETLRAFLSSPLLAEKMQAAGVGKPSILYVHGAAPTSDCMSYTPHVDHDRRPGAWRASGNDAM